MTPSPNGCACPTTTLLQLHADLAVGSESMVVLEPEDEEHMGAQDCANGSVVERILEESAVHLATESILE